MTDSISMPNSEIIPVDPTTTPVKGNKKRRKEQFTRHAILNILKQEGPQDSKMLSKQLGVTAMGVRQHLYALKDEGLITYTEESRPMGRPAKLWELTQLADKFFPDANAALLVEMLGHLSTVFGEEGLSKLVNKRAEAQLKNYQQRMGGIQTLEEKIDKLVEIRSDEGYMSESQKQKDGSYLFIENHCPICAGAEACQNFCSAEILVFESVLGPHVKVKRLEHILQKARRCVYEVTQELV